jgi:5-formyltetrahydrofolate cyclo-ligase
LLLPVSPTTRSGSRGKPATRRTLLSRRDALTEIERALKSAVIGEAAIEWLEDKLAPGSVVALYAAKGSEVETSAIDAAMRAAGMIVVYPRVQTDRKELAFHRATLEELVPARFGLREPRLDAPAIAIDAIDAFIVPGLAFDTHGGRMGWGYGHYDATFAAARAGVPRVGVGFECQVVESVPREPHDQLLDVIISEDATHTVG